MISKWRGLPKRYAATSLLRVLGRSLARSAPARLEIARSTISPPWCQSYDGGSRSLRCMQTPSPSSSSLICKPSGDRHARFKIGCRMWRELPNHSSSGLHRIGCKLSYSANYKPHTPDFVMTGHRVELSARLHTFVIELLGICLVGQTPSAQPLW